MLLQQLLPPLLLWLMWLAAVAARPAACTAPDAAAAAVSAVAAAMHTLQTPFLTACSSCLVKLHFCNVTIVEVHDHYAVKAHHTLRGGIGLLEFALVTCSL